MCKPRRFEITHTVQAWIHIEKSILILQNCIFTKGFFYSSTALRHDFTFIMRDVRAVGLPKHFNPFLAKVEEVRQNLKELLCTSFWDAEADIIWTSPADFQTNKQSLSSSFFFFVTGCLWTSGFSSPSRERIWFATRRSYFGDVWAHLSFA